jgi:hypothetical protein
LRAKDYCAVHLARQTDSAHLTPGLRRCGVQLGYRFFQRLPPVLGLLFAPAGLRALHRQRGVDTALHAVPGVE